MEIKDYILQATENFKFKFNEIQITQLETYYNLLVEWNEKMNLTAITDAQGVVVKHFADSVSVLNYVDFPYNSSIIDVGTGAGFPGVVLKIARPDIKLTLLDSLNKRLVFLQNVLGEINLSADLIHSRAEDGGRDKNLRESFDYAVSRAVANMNVLSEYCLPYVHVGGSFLAFKGRGAESEISAAKSAIKKLGGKIAETYNFALPFDGGERAIVQIQKIAETPNKYPRNAGKIKSSPLK
ncbi:16S rRNA (guanine(527)-N(7))-methyltransferase RsmG [Ruminococcus sp. YE282]|uniref:16S rRNA (guanine(527)-N(7))-methyltransferase RsmG n=1 Tax=Ruminococcus sp. YE282 TaxID=3158780 RepID=UPI000891A468|nr:16S rRNA (guanine527-N7)-methyltransferase [Ruminococcus bromii]